MVSLIFVNLVSETKVPEVNQVSRVFDCKRDQSKK